MPESDRLREVLEKCPRDELRGLASVAHGLEEAKKEWEALSNDELRRLVERELRYQGSSSLAFLWRRTLRGPEEAGVPYSEIVNDLIKATQVNESLVRRMEDLLGDPLYAREIVLTILMANLEPERAGLAPPKEPVLAGMLGAGLAALRLGGAGAYETILRAARGLARAVGGGGLSTAAGSAFSRTLGLVLGPLAAGVMVADAARWIYKLQGPDLVRCAMSAAAVGALRLKYFPLPGDKRREVERLIESLGRECRECRQPLKASDGICMNCLIGLHEGCGTRMVHLDSGAKGLVCSDCRRKDMEGPGHLMPAAGSIFSAGECMEALGYRAQVLNNRLDRTADRIVLGLEEVVSNIHRLRKDMTSDLRSLLRTAFGYLYVMFFTTLFLTLLGIAYFRVASGQPPGAIPPGVLFRLSLLTMILIPSAIWLAGALYRAARNARREDFERRPDGRRLGLKDYLFGFLYYDHPVENIWGPITLIGTTVLIVMWLFLLR